MAGGWRYYLEFGAEQLELQEGTQTVGRSRECEVTVHHPSVSRKHLRFHVNAGSVTIEDLGSSNGTVLRGQPVRGTAELQNGDVLELGDTKVRLVIVPPPEPEPSPLQTVRIPAVAGAKPLGDATFFLQRASVELAEQALDAAEELSEPEVSPTASPWAASPPTAPPAAADPLVTDSLPEASFAGLFDSSPVIPTPELPVVPAPPAPQTMPAAMPPAAVSAKPTVPPKPAAPPLPTAASGPATVPPPLPLVSSAVPPAPSIPPPLAAAPAISPLPKSVPPKPPLRVPSGTLSPPPMSPPASLPPKVGVPSGSEKPRPAGRRTEILPSLDELEAVIGPPLPELPKPELAAHRSQGQRHAGGPLQPAGFGPRLAAALLDGLWMTVLNAVALLGAGGPTSSAGSLALGISAAAAWVVVVLGWGLWGTTPGKRLLGLYVGLAPNGSPGIGVGRALLRAVGYLVSAGLLGVGFLMVAFSSSKRGLHDLIAGTYVGRR